MIQMKNKLILGTITALLTFFNTFSATSISEFVTNVNTEKAREIIAEYYQNPNFAILDVRTPEEYEISHIPDAFNIDFYSPVFSEELNKLDKSMIYLIYCRSGNRSSQAIEKMIKLGFKNIYHLNRGYMNW